MLFIGHLKAISKVCQHQNDHMTTKKEIMTAKFDLHIPKYWLKID